MTNVEAAESVNSNLISLSLDSGAVRDYGESDYDINTARRTISQADDDVKRKSKHVLTPVTNGLSHTGKVNAEDDACGPAEEPWSAGCVVGLKIYAYKTVATTRVRNSDGQIVNTVAFDVDDAKSGGELGKLTTLFSLSLLDASITRNLRKIKVRYKKKSMKVRLRFRHKQRW